MSVCVFQFIINSQSNVFGKPSSLLSGPLPVPDESTISALIEQCPTMPSIMRSAEGAMHNKN